MRKRKMNSSERRKVAGAFSLILQFSINMLVPILGMSLIGYYLDRHFETSWIFIVCFFVGAIAGGQNVYRLAMRVMRGPEEERDRSTEEN